MPGQVGQTASIFSDLVTTELRGALVERPARNQLLARISPQLDGEVMIQCELNNLHLNAPVSVRTLMANGVRPLCVETIFRPHTDETTGMTNWARETYFKSPRSQVLKEIHDEHVNRISDQVYLSTGLQDVREWRSIDGQGEVVDREQASATEETQLIEFTPPSALRFSDIVREVDVHLKSLYTQVELIRSLPDSSLREEVLHATLEEMEVTVGKHEAFAERLVRENHLQEQRGEVTEGEDPFAERFYKQGVDLMKLSNELSSSV